jgi:hypothetical protein
MPTCIGGLTPAGVLTVVFLITNVKGCWCLLVNVFYYLHPKLVVSTLSRYDVYLYTETCLDTCVARQS